MSHTHPLKRLTHSGRTSRSVTHPQISPGQARLTSEFFGDRLPEKKLQLVGINILLILLNPGPGYHILTPLRDRRPRRSIPSQEHTLLATSRTSSANGPCATSVRPVPTVSVRRPCVQCERRIPDARALTRHAPVHLRPSQTNICLFCTLCPHSCTLRKNFPVGHISSNCSGPSTLNLGVL